MAEMVGHIGIEGSLDEGLGQLFEKAFLADEVFRLIVIRQEGVEQVDWRGLACGVSSHFVVDYRQLTVYTKYFTPPPCDPSELPFFKVASQKTGAQNFQSLSDKNDHRMFRIS